LRLPRLRPDLAPLRDSRDFRLVLIGSFLSGLGAQATLVALPYQVYIQMRSALLVGLLGAVELAAAAAIGHPSIAVLYALALEYGLGTLTMVAGPAVGGLVISALGLTWAYAIDAISCAALARTLWLAATLFALAGAADSISTVCRTAINQTVTPERMRGRMSAVYSLVVSGGPRLGDIESGAVAGATSARFSGFSGGVLCVIGVAAVVVAFPALLRYDAEDWITAPVVSST
jgi:Transmembrane secretion effector